MLLLSSQILFADGSKSFNPEPPAYVLNFEYQRTAFDYREYLSDRTLFNTEKTDGFNGFGVEAKAKIWDGLLGNANYAGLRYERSYGDTDYVGSYLGSSGGYGSVTSTTYNEIEDISLRLTEEYLGETYDLSLGIGGGYRSWKRELSSIQLETYKWWYWSLDVGAGYHFNKNISLGIAYAYKKASSPKMDAEFDSYPFMSFDLGGVQGYSLSFPLVYTIDKDVALYAEYKREYFEIIHSNTLTILHLGTLYNVSEPDSTTTIDKFTFGIRFKIGE